MTFPINGKIKNTWKSIGNVRNHPPDDWLVVKFSEKTSKSAGMMTFPTEWKHRIHVPNHQLDEEMMMDHEICSGLMIVLSCSICQHNDRPEGCKPHLVGGFNPSEKY